MTRASVAIFPNKLDYSDNRTRPLTPPEVFEAASRVAQNKGCELIRSSTGLYVVQYSKSGPGKTAEGWNGWLPVYIARIETWCSGGIQELEMQEFIDSKEKKQ